MIDGGEDVFVPLAGAPGSRARGSRRAPRGSPGRSGPAIVSSQASTSTVIVGRVAGSIWCGTSARISPDVRPDDLARGCTRDDDAGAEDEDHRDDHGDPERPTGPRPGLALPPTTSRVTNRRRSSAAERGSGTSRSRSGRAAQMTTRPARRPTLVPNSSVWGAIRSVLATATSTAEHDATDPPGRHGLRVGDHEEQEDQDLGRGDDHAPEVEAADGRERPVARSCSARTRRATPRPTASVTQKPPRAPAAAGAA